MTPISIPIPRCRKKRVGAARPSRGQCRRDSGGARIARVLVFAALLIGPWGNAFASNDRNHDRTRPNILFIIMDDVGIDQMQSFGYGGATPPDMPTIDEIGNEGILFRQAFAQRAAMENHQHEGNHQRRQIAQFQVEQRAADRAQHRPERHLQGEPHAQLLGMLQDRRRSPSERLENPTSLEAKSRLKSEPSGGAKVGQGLTKGLTDRAAGAEASFGECWDKIGGRGGQTRDAAI